MSITNANFTSCAHGQNSVRYEEGLREKSFQKTFVLFFGDSFDQRYVCAIFRVSLKVCFAKFSFIPFDPLEWPPLNK